MYFYFTRCQSISYQMIFFFFFFLILSCWGLLSGFLGQEKTMEEEIQNSGRDEVNFLSN